MKILLNDYGGYPFPFELCKELSHRGHEIYYVFTQASGNPKGNFDKVENIHIFNIKMSVVQKDKFIHRFFLELKYGARVSALIKMYRPDIVLSANTPLLAQKRIFKRCQADGIQFIFWLQDIIGIAAFNLLSVRLGSLGKVIGLYFRWLEKKILSHSHHIISICSEFLQTLTEWGISENKVTVITNWAPVEQLPVLEKSNIFSKEYNLINKFVVLYSGTLGMKHDPDVILDAAQNLDSYKDIIFLVVAGGVGFDKLKKDNEVLNLDNLILLPLQPFEMVPNVLASADLLLTLLEPQAAQYSVPSKVWSYFCAGRPLLMIGPKLNYAAKVIEQANAGLVLPNEEKYQISKTILDFKNNPDKFSSCGLNARKYAEENFRLKPITDKFEEIFKLL